jgi:hypothetical protein
VCGVCGGGGMPVCRQRVYKTGIHGYVAEVFLPGIETSLHCQDGAAFCVLVCVRPTATEDSMACT